MKPSSRDEDAGGEDPSPRRMTPLHVLVSRGPENAHGSPGPKSRARLLPALRGFSSWFLAPRSGQDRNPVPPTEQAWFTDQRGNARGSLVPSSHLSSESQGCLLPDLPCLMDSSFQKLRWPQAQTIGLLFKSAGFPPTHLISP